MSADLATKPWAELTADEKIILRREARARATQRDRVRREAAPPARKPAAPVSLRVSRWCEKLDHAWCGRDLTCDCHCHRRAS